jgi:hypothetical protein
VYAYVDRADLPEVFNHFDFANPDMESGKRYQTTVPQQALFLMNSPLVVEQARNLVERPEVVSTRTDEERIQTLYRLVYQRSAQPQEVSLGLDFLEQAAPTSTAAAPLEAGNARIAKAAARRAGRQNPNRFNAGKLRPLTAWAEYAHALLLANETSFVN